MKRVLTLSAVLILAVPVLAQDSKEVTTVKSETTTVSKGVDLLTGGTFNVIDATPLTTNTIDLLFSYRWLTASAPTNGGDSDDDSLVQPTLVWGAMENLELSVGVPVWVGDAGDIPGQGDGNADTHLGTLWRVMDQNGYWPALALAGSIRTPTGDRSSGVDGEARLVLTNEYDSGIRSHINGFVATVNGNNDEDFRHFQWGLLAGLDGPLCAGGAVRWVADYLHRSSHHYGASNINELELGWQWQIADAHKLGMSTRIGLDDNEDTPNFGTGFTYAYTISY